MAQAIHCDGEGHLEVLADVMVSNLANGDTSAWCFAHYVDVSRALVDTFDQAVAEKEAAEVAARLEGITPPEGSDQAPDAGGSEVPAELPADDPEGTATAELPGGPEAPEPAPAPPDLGVGTFRPEGDQPVQEGLGSSETGAAGQPDSEPTAVENGPPGQPGGATEDAGEAEAEPAEDVATA